ncbi:putative heat shock factor like protein [Nosema granulosis]|uniref:Heat shock factor like protein n=1 Tax=Nosema granulosis TaxID=83296 RepID=A0A9P6GX84_9MICR|nr:putative heat shock factor like protein [Nosema granulosis]
MKNDLNFNKVSKFVKKLYDIVSDDNIQDIRWTEEGNGFGIYNKDNFMKNILPLISKTREYSAFIRQLNLYGFIKVKSSTQLCEEYFHSNFQKNREDLLPFVKHEKEKNLSVYENKPRIIGVDPRYQEALECLSRRNYILENEVSHLKERVEKQECTINGLIEILSRMFQFSKSEEGTLQLMSNQKNFETLRLNHNEDPIQECRPQEKNKFVYNNFEDPKEIFQLARNNFELEKRKQAEENHRNLRREVFGDSDEEKNDICYDDFF